MYFDADVISSKFWLLLQKKINIRVIPINVSVYNSTTLSPTKTGNSAADGNLV